MQSLSHLVPILGFIGVVLTLLVTVFIKPVFETWYNHRKVFSIDANAIYNIDNKTGKPYQSISKVYSNFIFNQVTVHQKSKASQGITKIELFDITKTDYASPDIQYDGGFYEQGQRLLLLAYNNGNAQGDSGDLTIMFNVIGEDRQVITSYNEHIVRGSSLDSGEINSLWLHSFDEMIADFKANEQYWGIEISVTYAKSNDSRKIDLIFDRNSKTFRNYGLGSGPVEIDLLPVLDIRQDESKRSVPCQIELNEGNNSIDFTVLVDRTCQLSYRLALWSGKKRVKSEEAYHINIRVPIYNQEQGNFYRDFYQFFKKEPDLIDYYPFNYTADVIDAIDKSLLYDKYKAVKKIYHLKD